MCWRILRNKTTALRRRCEPFLRRATRRCARRRRFCSFWYTRGFSISLPSDSTANEVNPTSIPTAASDAGNGCTEVSTAKHTYQCSHSRFTETVLILPCRGRCNLTLMLPTPCTYRCPEVCILLPSP